MTPAIDPTIDVMGLFMLGLMGTGHCIGMCGPLVVALPGQTGRFSAHLFYHAGRLITYGVIGGIMGGVGSGLIRMAAGLGADPMAWMIRTQVGLSLLAAIFLFLLGLSRLGFVSEPQWLSIAAPNRIPGWRKLMSKKGHRRSDGDLFLMGLLLGGLPCGLSYAAFTKSMANAQIPSGALLAFVFGLGTLPGLLAIGAGAAAMMRRYRQHTEIASGLIMIGMAAMLLVKVMEAMGG